MADGGEPGVDASDEGKHTGRNDLLFVEKMMWIVDGRASSEFDDTMLYQILTMVFVLAILKCNFIFTWKVYRDRFVAK